MNFSRISNIRQDNELSQQELARIIGGNRVSVCNWEREREIPNINKANAIADYFNVSLDYLFNLSNRKNYPNNRKGEIDRKIVGTRLRRLRQTNGLTLQKLANLLNTTCSTISAYESGKTLLLTAFAIAICKRYNVSMDWLYGKSDIQERN